MIPKRGGLVRGVTYIHTWGHAGGRRLTKKIIIIVDIVVRKFLVKVCDPKVVSQGLGYMVGYRGI